MEVNNGLIPWIIDVVYENRVLFIVSVMLMTMFLAPDLRAQVTEYYTGVKARTEILKEQRISLQVKEEIRFRDSGFYYRKSFIGLSRKVNRGLEISVFYALRHIKKTGWTQKHMAWIETSLKTNVKIFGVESNSKFERHITAEFWRLREKVRLIYFLHKKVSVWFGDEVRYFFKDGRIGENEILFGVLSPITERLKFELFYDIRRFFIDGYLGDGNCYRLAFSATF